MWHCMCWKVNHFYPACTEAELAKCLEGILLILNLGFMLTSFLLVCRISGFMTFMYTYFFFMTDRYGLWTTPHINRVCNHLETFLLDIRGTNYLCSQNSCHMLPLYSIIYWETVIKKDNSRMHTWLSYLIHAVHLWHLLMYGHEISAPPRN